MRLGHGYLLSPTAKEGVDGDSKIFVEVLMLRPGSWLGGVRKLLWIMGLLGIGAVGSPDGEDLVYIIDDDPVRVPLVLLGL